MLKNDEELRKQTPALEKGVPQEPTEYTVLPVLRMEVQSTASEEPKVPSFRLNPVFAMNEEEVKNQALD